MNVRFWGVRGSVPVPGAASLRYGGNTSCLEIGDAGTERLVIDCGSGLRVLGDSVAHQPPRRWNILVTHFHWDHIQGLPFFAPLYQPGAEVIIHAHAPPEVIRRNLEMQMTAPYFPVAFADIAARLQFRSVEHRQPFGIGSTEVTPIALQHPQGATGYRVAADGIAMVHACDHECGNAEIDAGLESAANGANLLVMDAQYTPEEYTAKIGWGHSSYAHCTALAAKTHVERLLLFHHDPAHDDAFLNHMLCEAQKLYRHTEIAREGDVILLGESSDRSRDRDLDRP